MRQLPRVAAFFDFIVDEFDARCGRSSSADRRATQQLLFARRLTQVKRTAPARV
jgi:hypothetical protein